MSSWVAKNGFLTQNEMRNNVLILYDFFARRGWTKQAMAAMFGNMEKESTINPGIWESLRPYGGGFGLVQWTPYTKFSSWAGAGWETAYDKQPMRIQYELENGLQWEDYRPGIATPGLTFENLAYGDMEDLTFGQIVNAFMQHYENPYAPTADLNGRIAAAERWASFIHDFPTPVGGTIPIWMLFKIRVKG